LAIMSAKVAKASKSNVADAIDLKCIYLDAMLWEKVGGQFCNICDLPTKNHRFLRQLLEVDAVIVYKNSEQCGRIC